MSDSPTITSFVVGTDDGNPADYSNWLDGPANWTHTIVADADSLLVNPELATPHGFLAPTPVLQTAYMIIWSGPVFTLDPGDNTLSLGDIFGFDNPNQPENVQWIDSNGDRADWSQVVAGGLGVYDGGPVHAPYVPEPSTIIIWSLLGGLAITVGWWRRRKAA
jgi:hypothetical protein